MSGGRDTSTEHNIGRPIFDLPTPIISTTHLRIEVAVHEHDRICGDQVEADAARPRAQQEDERAVARVEVVDSCKALLATHRAVEAFVGVATKAQIVL